MRPALVPVRISAFGASTAKGRHWRILGLFGIALISTPQLVHSQTDDNFKQCLDRCFNVCDAGPEILAFGCRSDCIGSCEKRSQNAPTPYGAIAFGTHGGEGISWNKGTWAAAGQGAIATCSKYGSNCRVVYQFQNTCAALAVAKGGQHFEAATGATEKQAEAAATAMCHQHWGTCLSDLSACSLLKGNQAVARTNPAPQPQGASWGAIAYSAPDMKAGWSFGKSDQALAGREAMSACSQRGRACALQTIFYKQCAALAADRSFVGWATSTQPREAQQKAIEQCTKDGGENCVLHVFFCSF